MHPELNMSSFEFKFLLAMYDYLEKYPEQHHRTAEVNNKATYHCFGGSYWATGELIEGENEQETQPLALMHFQLLKLADAATKWKGDDVRGWLEIMSNFGLKNLTIGTSRGFLHFLHALQGLEKIQNIV
jgi:hypothetical protein